MRGEFHLLIATMLAAIGWIASKLVIEGIPGDVFIMSRFFIASLILLPFCYKKVIIKQSTIHNMKLILLIV